VAGGVPWRENQSDAAIAEYIDIAVDKLKVFRGAQQLTRQRHELIYVVVRPVGGIYPTILSRCIRIVASGNKPTLPMWSPCVCDIATRAISRGFSPISAS
jgi:hypothetical protein